MNESSVPVIVLSTREDDVELVNRSLREAGHPARCHWQKDLDKLGAAIEAAEPHLIAFFRNSVGGEVGAILRVCRQHQCRAPLIVLDDSADENAIGDVLQTGARDLVSIGQRERLKAVATRELNAFWLERGRDRALAATTQYQAQLKSLMAASVDAIAEIQEGIIVDSNKAWLDLLGLESAELGHGPLMDFVDPASQAALKGALLACAKGKWDGTALKIRARHADGKAKPIEIRLEASHFDGEPAVKVLVQRAVEQPDPVAVPAQSDRDVPTGFLARQRFIEVLRQKIGERRQSGARALAFIRVDKFRELQNEIGPIASEEVIVQLASLLAGMTGERDNCGRFGGTVLAIVLERGTLRDIQAWAEHAVTRIAESILDVHARTVSITCTIGIAEMGAGTEGAEALLESAERANRAGREAGGNRVIVEETSDENTRIRRFDSLWAHQIKSAIVENRFRLVHLGIASLSGNGGVMLDTVLRLIDQQGDEIAATEFMESARRNNLARAVDRWVVAASIAYCAMHDCDALFVKLSRDSLVDPHVAKWIADQCREKSVAPRRLVIQVAEAEAAQHLKQVQMLSRQLKQAGARFAIEHFGIGRDPLRLLSQTPLDFIKIDGSLMQSVAGSEALQERITQLIEAASRHDVETIAERVDDANTMAVLFQLGVGYMQGHYVHEPEVVLEASA